jgi:hypothetical protein
MGQYFTAYLRQKNKEMAFDHKIDGDYNGMKLMEHSYWANGYVGQVVSKLFYEKGNVCWVGDYFDEDDYDQVNCQDKAFIKRIGELVWNDDTKWLKGSKKNIRTLSDCLLVNHTKKIFINGNEYYQKNKWTETWDGKTYDWCVHPLPLLTCSANHSGGSYYGKDKNECGTWFNDLLEVVIYLDENSLIEKGYKKVEYNFSEKE